eukprot:2319367-Prymnesium_polylepis.1
MSATSLLLLLCAEDSRIVLPPRPPALLNTSALRMRQGHDKKAFESLQETCCSVPARDAFAPSTQALRAAQVLPTAQLQALDAKAKQGTKPLYPKLPALVNDCVAPPLLKFSTLPEVRPTLRKRPSDEAVTPHRQRLRHQPPALAYPADSSCSQPPAARIHAVDLLHIFEDAGASNTGANAQTPQPPKDGHNFSQPITKRCLQHSPPLLLSLPALPAA